VQICSPAAARGLTTSFYGMALQGSIALGSFVFGLLSRYVGVSPSILVAGLLALTGLLLVRRYPLPDPAGPLDPPHRVQPPDSTSSDNSSHRFSLPAISSSN